VVRQTDLTSLGDEALMARIRDGDERALATLYDRHGQLVYSLARAILSADADAEEITEDVFVTLWTAPERFDPARGSLRAWIATIARTRSLDRLRSSKRRQSAHERAAALGEEGIAVGPAEAEAADERALLADARASLDRALSVLNQDQRRAVELAYFQGLSQAEIAAALDEPLGTVKTRLRDGMSKLRAFLRAPEGALR
jgi:RNA polymerase sigma-70 factor (ECF subfamily)